MNNLKAINQALAETMSEMNKKWMKEKEFDRIINEKTKNREIPLVIYAWNGKHFSYKSIYNRYFQCWEHAGRKAVSVGSRSFQPEEIFLANKILQRKLFEIDDEIDKLNKKKQR